MNITIENLFYTYEEASRATLQNISLTIQSGEFVVLTGRSGCGKTTLTRCINGLIPHFYDGKIQGHVYIDTDDTQKLEMHQLAKRVGSVFQDPRSQFFTTTTTEEIAFGCENLSMPTQKIEHNLEKSFVALHAKSLKGRSVFDLSSGEKQKIAIASVYAMQPQIFVLDEPSANLDSDATAMLGETLKHFKKAGHTVVVSEHKLYYLTHLADRFVYMENGRIRSNWAQTAALSMPWQQRQTLGLRAFDRPADRKKQKQKSSMRQSAPLLEVKDLSVWRKSKPIFTGLSFCAGGKPNEIIGVTGGNGIGKTTLARTLCGLLKPQEGTIAINGTVVPEKHRRKQINFVMQDADYQLFTESVDAELRFGHKASPQLDADIENTLPILGLKGLEEAHPMTLSGGQKQRLTIACAVLSKAEILVLDEPTSGLDWNSMMSLVKLLELLAEKGKLILVISHDEEFLFHCCDRTIVLGKDKRSLCA